MLAPSPQPPSLAKRLLDALKPPRARPFSEMGVHGAAHYGGYIATREKSSAWVGAQRYITIADMAVNTAIIATGVHYFLNLIAHPKWAFEPADESGEAEQAAEFVQSVVEDMTYTPWSRVVRRVGTHRFYGFSVQEWTAKRRRDGKVGLHAIEPRPQFTIERWALGGDGHVEGVFQVSPITGRELGIPRSKLLYLCDDTLSDSPEGVGIFRHLADSWERLKALYELEQRGFERDLRGTPVGRVPYTLIREAVAEGAVTQAQADTMTKAMENFVKLQVKKSDTAITLDSIPYYSQAADGSKVAALPQWGLELLQGGAAGMAEVGASIVRTQTEMARLLTCEHLMMGESSGNRALSEDKSRNLYLIANAVLSDIVAGVKLDVVPRVCDLNGIPEELYPRPKVEDVAFKDAEAVAATLAKMAQAGAVLAPDDPVIEDVRNLMGVSAPTPIPPELIGLGNKEGEEEDELEENPGVEAEADSDAAADADEEDAEKRFDPNQPRDPKGSPTGGQWTDGGSDAAGDEDFVAYHGTTDVVLSSIMKDGISPQHGKNFMLGALYEGDRGQSVYVSGSRAAAEDYAGHAAEISGGVPVVLTVRIPNSKTSTLVRDLAGGENAFSHTGAIPPEWIERASEIKLLPKAQRTQDKWYFTRRILYNRAKKVEAQALYVVVLADEEDAEKRDRQFQKWYDEASGAGYSADQMLEHLDQHEAALLEKSGDPGALRMIEELREWVAAR